MNASDALDILLQTFPIQRAGLSIDGYPEYDFAGDFPFVAAEASETEVRLTMPLPALSTALAEKPALARRLLSGMVQGAETGAGQIGIHPTLGAALIEVIDCAGLEPTDFQMRFVNFSLYAEYWRSEGERAVINSATASAALPEMMLRL